MRIHALDACNASLTSLTRGQGIRVGTGTGVGRGARRADASAVTQRFPAPIGPPRDAWLTQRARTQQGDALTRTAGFAQSLQRSWAGDYSTPMRNEGKAHSHLNVRPQDKDTRAPSLRVAGADHTSVFARAS